MPYEKGLNIVKKQQRLILITCCIVLFMFASIEAKLHWGESAEAFSDALIKQGSKGSDVRELQGRLSFLGFHDGKVDAVFGPATLKSLRTFQQQFGLKVDGIAGPKTKLKLWEATKQWKPGDEEQQAGQQGAQQDLNQAQQAAEAPQHQTGKNRNRGFSENDIKLMANAVYGEARGEPYEGQIAVAAVILNRVESETFPNTVSGVIFEPRAFTAVADGQIWLEPNETARRAVQDAINGMDPSDGCEYYFNPDTATSAWIWTRPQHKKIGKHIFCR